MDDSRRIWLVVNASSGSNDEQALSLLEETCGDEGFVVAHRTQFPLYELPTPAMLDAAGIDLVAIFAGDGTINSAITALAGWSGAVLILPGGTMNLLYHRLHGTLEMREVICAAAQGRASRRRPGMIRGARADALAGLMAGPGTSWNGVREAMRDNAILDLAGQTIEAIEETVAGAMIAVTEPALGTAGRLSAGAASAGRRRDRGAGLPRRERRRLSGPDLPRCSSATSARDRTMRSARRARWCWRAPMADPSACWSMASRPRWMARARPSSWSRARSTLLATDPRGGRTADHA